MKPYYLSIGVYILLCILTYYWLYNVINFDFITKENFADNTVSTSYFDSAKIGTPYYIIDSTNYLCLTLSDDNKNISMQPYPNDTNLRQLWLPILDGTVPIKSPPTNDRSCNKITQNAISYLPKEFMLQNFYNKAIYLTVNYNSTLNKFEFIPETLKTIYTNRQANNLDSPIFTGEINDRNQCTDAGSCLTCTKCTGYNRDVNGQRCVQSRFDQTRGPRGQSTSGWEGQNAYLNCGGYSTITGGTWYYGTKDYYYSRWGSSGPHNWWSQPLSNRPDTRGCAGRGSCSWNVSNGSWHNDPVPWRRKQFQVDYSCSADGVYTCTKYEPTYTPYYCQKCKRFTGRYNPKTCSDQTNNLPLIRRYKFENNKLTLVNKINIPGDNVYNSSTQYVTINNNKAPTVTISNPINFYFAPREHRNRFYQQYLIRNNLLPRNVDLQDAITEDVQNNTLPQ